MGLRNRSHNENVIEVEKQWQKVTGTMIRDRDQLIQGINSEWNKKIASGAKRKKAHRENQRKGVGEEQVTGGFSLRVEGPGPPASPCPLLSTHSTPRSSARSSLDSTPCSSTWELPVLCTTQFRNGCSSVWFSNCFVDAIPVFAPEAYFPNEHRSTPHSTLSWYAASDGVGRQSVKGKVLEWKWESWGQPHFQLPLSPPCQTSPVTSGRVISKSLV